MKNYILCFLLSFGLVSCDKKLDNDIFDLIRKGEIVTFYYQNNEHGEWGGDEFFLKVYKNEGNGFFLADFEQKIMLSPDSDFEKKSLKMNRILLDESKLRKLDLSIKQLFYFKKNMDNEFPGHSGFRYSIKKGKDSILINMYLSSRWNSFEDLIINIKQNVRKN